MWARESSTVGNIASTVSKGRKMSESIGLRAIRFNLIPWPVSDFQSFQVIFELLRASQEEERNNSTHMFNLILLKKFVWYTPLCMKLVITLLVEYFQRRI